MKVGIVVPHIFMHQDILPGVIFAPGPLAQNLAEGLQTAGEEVTLLTPGPIQTTVRNITADTSYFEAELARRGDNYLDLLKKHPFTFISLARQLQSELIAKTYELANAGEFDLVHVYTNEEDIALPFAKFCKKPVVFTHHDPFNFLVKYKSLFPKYVKLNWISLSLAQRGGMPAETNWVGNIYHGLDPKIYKPNLRSKGDYLAYLGRIIEPKGLHLAIKALRQYNRDNKTYLKLKIAGKHYSEHKKDQYWTRKIWPLLESADIEYVGFLRKPADKQSFLSGAKALLVPSIFDEPFGMVAIEALASATPVIALDSGALPEIVINNKTGFIVNKIHKSKIDPKTKKPVKIIDEAKTASNLQAAIEKIGLIDRQDCRSDFEKRFTLERMCREHIKVYEKLIR